MKGQLIFVALVIVALSFMYSSELQRATLIEAKYTEVSRALAKVMECQEIENDFFNTVKSIPGGVNVYHRYPADTPPAATFFKEEYVVTLKDGEEKTFPVCK